MSTEVPLAAANVTKRLSPAAQALFVRASTPGRYCALDQSNFDTFSGLGVIQGDFLDWKITQLGAEVRTILLAREAAL